MRVKICGYLAAAIFLISSDAGLAQNSGEVENVIRNQKTASTRAEQTYERTVNKARQDAISQLTKMAKKAYAAKNRQGETEAWRAILRIDSNHQTAREYFTDLGSLDKELAALKPKERPTSNAVAPIQPAPKPAEAKPAAEQPVATKPAAPPAKPANPNLAAEKNLDEVRAKLKELNPGFKGVLKPEFSDGRVTGLSFSIEHVKNLEPLRGLIWLKTLHLENQSEDVSPLSDLSPLSSLPIILLTIKKAQITDLKPLADLRLLSFTCSNCPISDLSPLKGQRLQGLGISETHVTDLTPIQGAALHSFECTKTRVADLSPLKGMPLEGVRCENSEVIDLSPLAGATKLRYVDIANCAVTDLSPLQGLPIEQLTLTGSKVTDLSPIKGAPLQMLLCANTRVTKLSPIEDAPLRTLAYDFRNSADLAIVKSIDSLEWLNQKPAEQSIKEEEARLK